MIFSPTTLCDAQIIDLEVRKDERGYFARTMCTAEFASNGLPTCFVQANHSHNTQRGTLRGMHYQRAPYGEAKLVRCVRGAIFDVIIDLRLESPTYMRSEGFVLSADNGRTLYVPEGFAHGYQTLVNDTDVIYQVSCAYTPEAEAGVRYNDPSFRIAWPERVTAISSKDAGWPNFEETLMRES